MIELRDGIDAIKKGDIVKIGFENGVVIHEGNEYHFPALPKEVLAILEDVGQSSVCGRGWERRENASRLTIPVCGASLKTGSDGGCFPGL